MKRKIVITVLGMALFAGAAFFSIDMNNVNTQTNQLHNRNIEILEATAGYCPNGCLAQCGNGCYCNGSYPNNKEASHDKLKMQ
jgi:hypothetical protein